MSIRLTSLGLLGLFVVAVGASAAPLKIREFPDLRARRAALLGATVPGLIDALKDPDEKVRSAAASALDSLDCQSLPALIALLDGPDKKLRARAAEILGNMAAEGRPHVSALPSLTKALKDEDADLRGIAASAMRKIIAAATRNNPNPPQEVFWAKRLLELR